MKLLGFEWINTFQIIHIENEKSISTICFSEKSIFGFGLENIFEAIAEKHNRELKNLSKKSYGYDFG